jgi:hypothetical protein
MLRLVCSVMIACSVSLLAFGPTAAFAKDYPNCPAGKQCSGSEQGGSGKTCQTGGSGCTDFTQNPGGQHCSCQISIDNKCSTVCK